MAAYSTGDIRSLLGASTSGAPEAQVASVFASVQDTAKPIITPSTARPATVTSTDTGADPTSVSKRSKTIQKQRGEKRVELSVADKLAKDKCTLFVGNLPIDLAKRSFEAPFKAFGKIVSSRFRSCPVKEKYKKQNKKFGIMRRDFIDGVDEAKLTQNGYIVFADAASVTKAVETSGFGNTDLFKSGHHVRLDYVVMPEVESISSGAVRKFDRKKSIYIPHIPANATDLDVTTAVESADESLKNTIKGVRVVKTEKSGTFAFVLFADRASATKAVKIGSIHYTFGDKKSEVRFVRIMKDDEIAKENKKKQETAAKASRLAAKKSMSRVKWQARLTMKGNPKVVSHHAMPRKERQEKMGAAARRIFNNGTKKPSRK